MYGKMQKWDRWLHAICDDLKDEAACRVVYLETIAIVDSNANIPKDSEFLDCLERWYVNSAVMGLRRQLKISAEAFSLAGLLKDMADNACILSRDHLVSLYADQTLAHADFDRCIAPGAEHVPVTVIVGDLERLRHLAERCEKYADRLVAHRDKRGLGKLPTYAELDEAVSFAEELVKKYLFLLRGVAIVSVAPIFQRNWKRIFSIPWLPPGRPANSATAARGRVGL